MPCGHRRFRKIRTLKVSPDTYIHIGVRTSKGARGGTTEIYGKPFHVMKRKRKS